MSSRISKKKKKIPYVNGKNCKNLANAINKENMQTKIITETFHSLQYISYWVLHDKFGYGKKRILRTNADVVDCYKRYQNDTLKPDELAKFILGRTGIDMYEEAGKIPFRQKLAMAHVDFPKSPDMLHFYSVCCKGSFEAWMILFCSELIQNHRFSTNMIKKFLYEVEYLIDSIYLEYIDYWNLAEGMMEECGVDFSKEGIGM